MESRTLPIVTRSERVDFKRCEWKWYQLWRRGLVPKSKTFGALDLGEWLHAALADWYLPGTERTAAPLSHLFLVHAELAISLASASGSPENIIEKAEELAALGENMMQAYQKRYGTDEDVEVIRAEVPLEFSFPDHTGRVAALHKLKPDLVYRDRRNLGVWLMEHKSATSIHTEHLVIDDQARPYGAMAERALRKLGLIAPREELKGIMYNYMRKGLSDERPTNDAGKALNKNGTVSARQPAALFVRKPILMSRPAKRITLNRVRGETIGITTLATMIRANPGEHWPERLSKTPHHSCPKFCPVFALCEANENGADTTELERGLFDRRDPYTYYGETTSEHTSFEMG